ncbi:hypothetical protein DHEL01_v212621 [Diaporthe helianthi]|uniref:Uncharacterized protein n=1 Tax=Diaporthe helianthi TaxID=158607 RepID=A0A2P5HFF9_DIAHE|nr:hypothetical protein DHEL01_v212621 [Diaporthe helianthi]
MPNNDGGNLDRPVGELWVELTRDEKLMVCNALVDRNQPDVVQTLETLDNQDLLPLRDLVDFRDLRDHKDHRDRESLQRQWVRTLPLDSPLRPQVFKLPKAE